ncbi:chascon isoform d-related [Anaeramoeba flamelloides]|uniref:Chascon isoform d-related n=1 Tax=Anaeramoeba flamelloides TaxID=1746091 RepID=A0AAV7YFQ4_9EUKA|nr:chascon isoform d-related [Anaeramoeba flamelloides]
MFSVFTSPELFGSLRKIFPDLSVHKVFLEDQYSKLEKLTFSNSFSTMIADALCLSPSYKPEKRLAKDLKSQVLSQKGPSTIEIKKIVLVFRETTRDSIKTKQNLKTTRPQTKIEETQNNQNSHKKENNKQKKQQKQINKKNLILLDSDPETDPDPDTDTGSSPGSDTGDDSGKEINSNIKQTKYNLYHYDFFKENTFIIKSLKIKLWKDNSELFSLDFIHCELTMDEENITQLHCQKLEVDIKHDTLELFFPSEFQLLKQHKLIFRSVLIKRSPVSLFLKIGSLTTSYHDLCYLLFWRKAILHFSLLISPRFDYNFQIENFFYNLGVSCLFFSDFNLKFNANSSNFSLSSNKFKYELLLNEGFKLQTSLHPYRNQSKTRLKLIQGYEFSLNLMKNLKKIQIIDEKKMKMGNGDEGSISKKGENEKDNNEKININENEKKINENENENKNKNEKGVSKTTNNENGGGKEMERKKENKGEEHENENLHLQKLILKIRIKNLICAGRILNFVYLWYTFLDLYQRYRSFWNELTNESLFPKFLKIGFNIKITKIKSVLLWFLKLNSNIQTNNFNLNEISILKSTDLKSNILVNLKGIDSDFCSGKEIQFIKTKKGLKISKTIIQMKNKKNIFILFCEIFDYFHRITNIVKDELIKMDSTNFDKNQSSIQYWDSKKLLLDRNLIVTNNESEENENEGINKKKNIIKLETEKEKEKEKEKKKKEKEKEKETETEKGERKEKEMTNENEGEKEMGRERENKKEMKIEKEMEMEKEKEKEKKKTKETGKGKGTGKEQAKERGREMENVNVGNEIIKSKGKSKPLSSKKTSEKLFDQNKKSNKSKSIELEKEKSEKNQTELINNLLLETLKIQEKIARCKYQLTQFEDPLLFLVKNLQKKTSLTKNKRTSKTGSSTIKAPKTIPDKGAYMAGFGKKKGRVNKGWKKRWFILTKDRLRYFKRKQPLDEILHFELPLGSISLSNQVKVFRPEKKLVNKRKNCFAVKTQKRTFYIQPLNNSADDWISKIEDNIRGIRVNDYFKKKKERSSSLSSPNINQDESSLEVFKIYNAIKKQLDGVKVSHKNVMEILEVIKGSEND